MTFIKNNLGLIIYLVIALIANIVLVPTGKEMMDFILGFILGTAYILDWKRNLRKKV